MAVQRRLHREDGPAIEYADGTKACYRNGDLHRENGPAVEYAGGSKEWLRNGVRHRTDGPALECANGAQEWYLNGSLHREDGPAVEYADGTKEWCRNGKKLTAEEIAALIAAKEMRRLEGERHIETAVFDGIPCSLSVSRPLRLRPNQLKRSFVRQDFNATDAYQNYFNKATDASLRCVR